MNKNFKQTGVVHVLLLILLLVILIAVAAYVILPKLGVQLPSVPGVKQEPKVSVKTEYKNPFDKNTQYMNPFDQYKSPLVNLKK